MSRLFSRPDRWALTAFLALTAIVLVYNLGAAALFEPDEGRNAEIAREILVRHDWITPHYDYLPYLDKPMGFYWLIALSYRAIGVSEWAARLPSALSALLCVALVYDLARARFGSPAAVWAGIVIVTSPLFAIFAHATIFDMTLTACVTLAIWAHARLVVPSQGRAWTGMVVMGVALGGALLVKGPVGLAIPALVITIDAIVSRTGTSLVRRELWLAVGLGVLVAAPWYLLAESRNPGYLRYFFLKENFQRYLTPRFERPGPWYYYVGIIALGVAPWLPSLWVVAARAHAEIRHEASRALYLWVGAPLVFFSLAQSKLPGYILPVMPPLAVLLGAVLARAAAARPRRARWPVVASLALAASAAAAVAAMLFVPALTPASATASAGALAVLTTVRQALAPFAAPLVALFVVAIVAAVRTTPGVDSGNRLPVSSVVVAVCAAFALLYGLALRAEGPVAERYSSRDLAAVAAPLLRPDDQLVIYDAYFSSLPFYLAIDRPIWVVWPGLRGEVIGSPYVADAKRRSIAPAATTILTGPEFQARWTQATGRLVVVVERRRFARFLEETPTPPRTLLTFDDVLLVANR